jgi:hypothetical protein
LRYFVESEVWAFEGGGEDFSREMAKDASYILSETLARAAHIKEFCWSAPYPPYLPVLWPKLQQSSTLHKVYLEMRQLDAIYPEPDDFGIEVGSCDAHFLG